MKPADENDDIPVPVAARTNTLILMDRAGEPDWMTDYVITASAPGCRLPVPVLITAICSAWKNGPHLGFPLRIRDGCDAEKYETGTEKISSQALNTYTMKPYQYLVIAGALITLFTGVSLTSAENTELVDCGGTTYNPEYQSCCQGKVYEGTRYSRCGDTCYNMDNQTCCSRRVVDGPCFPECGEGYFNPSNQTCCQKHTYDGLKWGICGGTCYNLTTQSCCMGTIYEGLSWKKCGGVCYNPGVQTCCLNKVYDGKKEMKPCGRYDCYDIRNQTCSRGQISDTKPTNISTYW